MCNPQLEPQLEAPWRPLGNRLSHILTMWNPQLEPQLEAPLVDLLVYFTRFCTCSHFSHTQVFLLTWCFSRKVNSSATTPWLSSLTYNFLLLFSFVCSHCCCFVQGTWYIVSIGWYIRLFVVGHAIEELTNEVVVLFINYKSQNKGLISADRRNQSTLLLTIPCSII